MKLRIEQKDGKQGSCESLGETKRGFALPKPREPDEVRDQRRGKGLELHFSRASVPCLAEPAPHDTCDRLFGHPSAGEKLLYPLSGLCGPGRLKYRLEAMPSDVSTPAGSPHVIRILARALSAEATRSAERSVEVKRPVAVRATLEAGRALPSRTGHALFRQVEVERLFREATAHAR